MDFITLPTTLVYTQYKPPIGYIPAMYAIENAYMQKDGRRKGVKKRPDRLCERYIFDSLSCR